LSYLRKRIQDRVIFYIFLLKKLGISKSSFEGACVFEVGGVFCAGITLESVTGFLPNGL